MPSELVSAIWRGPFAAELPDSSLVYPGEQHLVTSEDLKSDHWEPVSPAGTTSQPSVPSTTSGTASISSLGASPAGPGPLSAEDED